MRDIHLTTEGYDKLIRAANYTTLTITRATDNGIYLTDGEDEILLPNRYVPQEYEIDDQIDVFVYHDSEDRLVATTETPKLIEGEMAALRVVGFNFHGVFMDWGLSKDLFVPKSNQREPMQVGETYLVSLYIDNVSGRPVGTAKIGRGVNNDDITVRLREEVEIMIAVRKPQGFRVIINEQHWGMLYDNQLFKDIELGTTMKAYVRKITEDLRIDVSLQQEGLNQVVVAADVILKLIDESEGTLTVGDKSTPEEVRLATGMSKKAFKRAVGYLMSHGVVVGGDNVTERIKTKNI